MKVKNKILSVLLSLCSVNMVAQNVPNPALTADSLATGNYKDVLNSFFQLSFDRITGPDKELKFTSTPFAVMAKLDSTMLTDLNYIRYNTLRNINFSFSAKLDSSYKFNGFSSGVKYALINKRDETVSRSFINLFANNENIKEFFFINDSLNRYISSLPDFDLKLKLMLQKTEFTKGQKNFNELDPVLQKKMIELTDNNNDTKNLSATLKTNSNFNIYKTAADIYEKMKKDFNNNLLWTVGITDTTYKDQFLFSNIVLSSEVLKGITNDNAKNDIELNIKSALQFIDDTLKTGRDLSRTIFSFEPGVNLVIKTRDTRKSFFEMKFSGSYYHIFNGLYTNEKNDRLTLNSTIRIRIINDIWIPLEIKYDPKEGNFLGVLNVRANFTALGGIAKFLKL